MAYAKHLIRLHNRTTGYNAWCGFKSHSDFSMTTYEQSINMCTKCSSRLYAEKTKTFPYRLADRLDLSNSPHRFTYKSIYPIIRVEDGAEMGFVTIKNGWGKDWEVRAFEGDTRMVNIEQNKAADLRMSDAINYRRSPDEVAEYGGSFNSKEHALFTVPLLIEQGKLISRADAEAKARETFATMRKAFEDNNAARARLRDEREATLSLIREEFAGMVGSGTLSNAQTVAVTKAAELLGVKLTA